MLGAGAWGTSTSRRVDRSTSPAFLSDSDPLTRTRAGNSRHSGLRGLLSLDGMHWLKYTRHRKMETGTATSRDGKTRRRIGRVPRSSPTVDQKENT